MKKTTMVMVLPLVLAGTFTLTALGLFLLDLRDTTQQFTRTGKDLSGALGQVKDLTARTDTQLNGFAGTSEKKYHDKVEGLLPQLRDVVRLGRGDAIALNRQESAYYTTLQTKTDTILTAMGDTIDTANTKLGALDTFQISQDLHRSFGSLNDALVAVPPVLGETKKTIETFNGIMSTDCGQGTPNFFILRDPQPCPAQILVNVAGITDNLNGISADGRKAFHQALNPPKKKIIGGAIVKALEWYAAHGWPF